WDMRRWMVYVVVLQGQPRTCNGRKALDNLKPRSMEGLGFHGACHSTSNPSHSASGADTLNLALKYNRFMGSLLRLPMTRLSSSCRLRSCGSAGCEASVTSPRLYAASQRHQIAQSSSTRASSSASIGERKYVSPHSSVLWSNSAS